MPVTLTQTSPRLGRLAALTAAVAVAIAGIGATPVEAATDGPVQIILDRTNDYRASKGKGALRLDSEINSVAQAWSNSMLSKSKLAHNPDYSKQMPSGWTRVGENVGYACGYGSAANAANAIMTAWLKSSGHEANIRGDYTDIGIGFAYSASKDCAYSTQNFGKYASSPSTVSVVGKITPPSGQSYSSLSGATVVIKGGGVTRSGKVSSVTGEYLVTDLPKGTYTLQVLPSSSSQTAEYFTDAVSTQCAARISLSKSDWTNADVKLTTNDLSSPSSKYWLCDVSSSKDSKYFSNSAAAIGWLADQGIYRGSSNGYGGYIFKESGKLTRDAFAAYLYRFSGEPSFTPPSVSPFSDITPSTKFYKEITWLYANGIITGYPVDGDKPRFRPAGRLTRGSTAKMLYGLAGAPSFKPPATSPFADLTPSTTSYKEITWLAEQGIVTGYSKSGKTIFRPGGFTTRGSMAKQLFRYDGAL